MNAIERFFIKKKAESLVDNAIKESGMSAPFKAWLIGATNATISGLAAGGFTMATGVDWKRSAVVALGSAGVSFLKWFVQHPIPGGTQ